MPGCNSLPTITISDEGGGSPVVLTGVNAPQPVPWPVAEYGVEIFPMRQGTDGMGYRAVQLSGATVAGQDYELEVLYLTDVQFAALNSKFYATPPKLLEVVVTDANDDPLFSAVACWQKNGWVPKLWPQDASRKGASIKLHFLGALS